jgi:hypothetical protein
MATTMRPPAITLPPFAAASIPPASAEQDRDEGAGFHQRVAADQFVLVQMLGQQRISPGRTGSSGSRAGTAPPAAPPGCGAEARQRDSMMAISSTFTRRVRRALSYLSASWPALAENRKKGRMKMPAARLASSAGRSSSSSPPGR